MAGRLTSGGKFISQVVSTLFIKVPWEVFESKPDIFEIQKKIQKGKGRKLSSCRDVVHCFPQVRLLALERLLQKLRHGWTDSGTLQTPIVVRLQHVGRTASRSTGGRVLQQ